MPKVIHAMVTKRDKDGKPYKVLQAFELVDGIRRPIETVKQTHNPPAKEKKK